MGSAGLRPYEVDEHPKRVSPERLAEFDRLYAEGGIDAIIETIKRQEICKAAA